MTPRSRLLLWFKLVLAFCSISYELLLAQSLSAFLSDTVLRYSVTIGLYMFSMGMGALVISGKRELLRPARLLWNTEVMLTVCGALALTSLFVFDHFAGSGWLFLLWAHLLIVMIGFLTGFELPLILSMADDRQTSTRNSIIALDYAGAFLGTVVFAFYFYPCAGLVTAPWMVALLNALAALILLENWKEEFEKNLFYPRLLNSIIIISLGVGLVCSGYWERFWIAVYLK